MVMTGTATARLWNIQIGQIPCVSTLTGNNFDIITRTNLQSGCLFSSARLPAVVHGDKWHDFFIQLSAKIDWNVTSFSKSRLHDLHPNKQGMLRNS